jgi:hypothetical protein
MGADLMITIVFCIEASFVLIVGSVVFLHEARKSHVEAALVQPPDLARVEERRERWS